MTPKPSRVNDFVGHIREASGRLQDYVRDLSKESFLADPKTQDAVIRNLLIIGEAAARILAEHPEFAAAQPGIPWHQMKGMRNRMVHGYFDTNLDLVWQTVDVFVPELNQQLIQLPQSSG